MILHLDYITFEYNQIYDIFSNLMSPYLASNNSIINNMTPTNKTQNTYSSTSIPNISFMATSKILSTIFQTQQGMVKYPFVTMQIKPQSVVDAGGAYDYASAQNADVKVGFFQDQANSINLFSQHVPLRVQNDNATLDLNIWQYSYQELNLIRDLIQRSFALSRRILQPIDLTQYILPSLSSSGMDINSALLDSLQITYNSALYFSLASAVDTTPTTITNQVPLIKFTYSFNFDAWLPTDVEIEPLTTLINEIVIYFNSINANNESTVDNITDVVGDLSTTPPTINVYYDYLNTLYFSYILNTLNIINNLQFTYGLTQISNIQFINNIQPMANLQFTYNIVS